MLTPYSFKVNVNLPARVPLQNRPDVAKAITKLLNGGGVAAPGMSWVRVARRGLCGGRKGLLASLALDATP